MKERKIVFEAITELIASDPTIAITIQDEANLYGNEGPLDSIKLLCLISLIELKVEEQLNISITLSDEKAFSLHSSPFRTCASLTQYVQEQIHDVHTLSSTSNGESLS